YSHRSLLDSHSFPTRRSSDLDVVTNKNVTYVTSAGNFGSRSFEGTFTEAAGALLPSGVSGIAHDFGGGNIFQGLNNIAASKIVRSEEHTSELQSLAYLVCRLL